MEEQEAIRLARSGDGDAFATLVTRYQEVAFRTAYLITGNAAEAEDAAQSAFVKAYFALGSFSGGAPFRPWLLTIVANEARNLRAASRRRPYVDLSAVEHVAAAEDGASPEQQAVLADRDQRLIDALNRLDGDDRTVIACRYFLGLGEAEMAAVLQCRRGTVKSRLSRAMARLRAVMTAEGGGASD